MIKWGQDTIKVDEEMEEFDSGALRGKNNLDKGRYDLVPWQAIHQLAIQCAKGAKVYGERNAEKGIPISSLIDSGMRHLSQYMQGKDDEDHLRAALWNISFAIWMREEKPEMQDIPSRLED